MRGGGRRRWRRARAAADGGGPSGAGTRRCLSRLQPRNTQDVIADISLFRPGPVAGGMPEQYIAARHGSMRRTCDQHAGQGLLSASTASDSRPTELPIAVVESGIDGTERSTESDRGTSRSLECGLASS
ncbi:hypothetical protein [Streptomyces sp. NPDC029004]|uniref:hypothetical protein n=1 Tax=Streptomyces sp. NPDC029004 TaxID=3154490 RepID=UPI0033E1FC70